MAFNLNWLNQLVSRSKQDRDQPQAHMTFAHSSVGRSLNRTRLLLKKQLWIWPVVAVLVLAVVGYAVSSSIQRTMESTLRSQLQTLLTVERAMLEKWLEVQESSATAMANDRSVRDIISQILASQPDSVDLSNQPMDIEQKQSLAELYSRLSKELEPGMTSHDFVGFVVADKQQRIIAATARDLIGQTIPEYESFLARTLEGRPTVSTPFASVSIVKDAAGKLRSGAPTMFVCAPVRDENLQIVAVLALRIRPEDEFTSILQLGRIGETGETYAINRDGLMVSNSRFDESLILLGLLPDTDQAASILNVDIRNPGVPMVEGHRPGVRRRELPLTDIATAAVSGSTGVRMEPYRDYRGSPSVGAYSWLPEYQMGIITEIDTAEAYRPLTILNGTFYSLYVLLGISALAIFIFTLIVARLQRQAQKATIEAKQLGQYRLQEKLGAGAMGVVYKGQHSMLRRPTAIKMLDVDKVNEGSIQRFEREVQITCNLNNPHTVAIYDYGRTPEGVFYYAMEYLDGINLQSLVDQDGPQPEGRVVHILKQICGSLYEAHSMGLVHRDIKPANIMLNRRGAEPDVVKVLDFGLVKAFDDKKEASNEMSGTPLYMSPESIQTPDLVDPRSDIYAVGAVGYFLLTGETAFSARSLSELCQQHVTAIPDAPSQKLGRAVSAELEHAILACLEKNRAKRPQTARDLATMLDRVTRHWSLDEAEAWWSRHERGQSHIREIMKSSPSGRPAAGNEPPKPGSATTPSAAYETRAGDPELDRTRVFDPSRDKPESP